MLKANVSIGSKVLRPFLWTGNLYILVQSHEYVTSEEYNLQSYHILPIRVMYVYEMDLRILR